MSRSEESPLTIGRVVDSRYEVTRTLSHGASGTVYQAEAIDGQSDAPEVALKVLHARFHGDRQLLGRFRREARILQRLQGEHLARLLDIVEEDGLLILVLEYIDGPSLAERLQREGAIPVADATDLALQLCAALAEAHDAGVIHRDLKPSNVLLAGWSLEHDDGAELGRPLVKVVDFGLSKILHGDSTGTALTEQDMIFGTPDYMSPEQVRGDELDHRCDIYALGAMLYQMLVGDVPFPTAGPLTTMTAHLEQPVPSPRRSAPERDIPAELDRIVVKALAKDRDDRYASARQFAEELEQQVAKPTPPRREEDEPADEGADDGDTLHEPQRLSNPVGTTLQSHRIPGLEGGSPRGAKVKVVVEEAAPASRDAAPASSEEAPTRQLNRAASRRRLDSLPGRGERRFWTIAALVAAVVAVAVGILFGVR